MKLNKLVSFIFLMFQFSSCLYSQFNLKFIEYLSENNLKNEHFTYLLTNENDSNLDSLEYLKAKFYIQYEEDSLFIDSYFKSVELCNSDTLVMNKASIYFLKSINQYKENWFNIDTSILESNLSKYIFNLHQCTKIPNLKSLSLIPEKLVLDYKKYYKYSRKSPLLAASLSTLIPGLGQLYIGNVKSFTTRITTQTLLAFQFLESNKKIGLYHPISILNASFFSVFYFVNIIGTYRDTNDKKEEFKNQFLINASNYLSVRTDFPLY